MSRARYKVPKERRRAVVAVQVMVLLTVLIGFAALTVDVGAMYNARADLQRTVDAAALAAADALGNFGTADPIELAKSRAADYVSMNPVFGKPLQLDAASDVVAGRAVYNAGSHTYAFTPTDVVPDAVYVRVRMTNDSPNGPLSLFFAGIFGKTSTELSADAIAMMVPRDIAIVADLSGSHNDDSELRHLRMTEINLFEVWAGLPIPKGRIGVGDGKYPPPAGVPGAQLDAPATGPCHPGSGSGGEDPGANPAGSGQIGPVWGWMYYWGNNTSLDYDPASDPGLIYLPRGQTWSNADLTAWYQSAGYSAAEITALLSSTYDSSSDSSSQYGWTNRAAVALGLARWDSGMAGGLWESIPPEQRKTGNGNNWAAANELTWLVNYPFDSGSWPDYIYNYVRSTTTYAYEADSDFRYRFGLKTFVNYLMEKKPSHNQTPELAETPTQPMQAVKDSVNHLTMVLDSLDTNDQVSLEVYGTTARHEVNLTPNYYTVSDRLNEMQAGHYDTQTNMGGGITRAIEELASGRARTTSRKVIFLLTDGQANVTESGAQNDYVGGKAYAVAQAEAAAAAGIQIFAVSVGADADGATMQQIAEIGGGTHFHASGSIAEYSAQLDQIFATLGGQRPVQLIK
jgi:Flp pilus assembly protein TadG